MNTTASFPSEPSWSRRCSTETVFSIQGQETDIVQDSSDSELDSDEDVEYEPYTASEEEAPISEATSGQSDAELISTTVVSVAARDDDLQLADSETGSAASEAEGQLPAYRSCARCRAANHNTRYRYCDKCFTLRKNFFPPRPRRKLKRETSSQEVVTLALSQDSGIESLNSQELASSQEGPAGSQEGPAGSQKVAPNKAGEGPSRLGKLKRRSESADRSYKRPRLNSGSESDRNTDEVEVAPLVKTVSDPAVTIETIDCKSEKDNLCIICLTEPKSGVFVHRRVAHICCCYNCAVKVWSKARRCPICNCKVSNVLKAVVM
ncbi:E3 ubiquitin-protein ligase Mdm2-like [Ostrinia furnacalis]|uniref:E3 ubiquitin-protein ligase Mdm2-like n=1 Tax=Ostrinia furnacalis TaxID=93504 RepID=UPI00103D8457|nr:E3 ubiquitin-protein ligase Mdm2-like [Ostrinia furnacalis]